MSAYFEVVETNPNEVTGGAGTVWSETRQTDDQGPYVVCFHTEMESNASPHTVIAFNQLKEMWDAIQGEVLSGGEKGFIEADEVVEIPIEKPAVITDEFLVSDPETDRDFDDDAIPEV